MPEPHDPVDHDPVGGDPINHDPIADAVQRARHDVAPIAGAALVDSVRAAQLRRQRKDRRAVGSIAGAAAVLILVAVGLVLSGTTSPSGVATRLTGGDTNNVTSSQLSDSRAAPGLVTVDPSTGLVDGQTVAVAAYDFDAGTTVAFFECGSWTVAPSTASTPSVPTTPSANTAPRGTPTTSNVASPSPDGSSISASGWTCAALATKGLAHSYELQHQVPSGASVDHSFEHEPTVAKSTFRVSTTLRYLSGVGVDGVVESDLTPGPVSCGENEAPVTETAPRGETGVTTSPRGYKCLIVARGTINGRLTAKAGPSIEFGSTGSNPSPTSEPVAPPPTDPSTDPSTTPTTTPQVTTLPAGSACSSIFPNIDDHTPRGAGPLVAFTPTAATICGYPQNALSCGKSAGKLLCNPNGVAVTDARTLVPLVAELNSLPTVLPGESLNCFLNAGPTVGIVLTAPGHRTNIRIQYFGCGEASNGKSLHVGATSLTLLKSLIGL